VLDARKPKLTFVLLGVAMFMAALSEPMRAATPPLAFKERPVASGLSAPTAMEFAPDGRLFVLLQAGTVRIIQNDVLLPTPFMSISVNASGERGLLGIAFDPNFASNQYFYLYYTTTADPYRNRVSRFTANGNAVLAGSEVTVIDLDPHAATNHNGGAIHFGADGKLYIATGDNAVSSNSQSLSNLHGKILRVNPDPSNLIPTDNPFYNDGGVVGLNKAIWAYGLRNPFTFAVQPGTGKLFINDVGQGDHEEVNEGVAGANYGWPICDGPNCSSSVPNHHPPVYAYLGYGAPCAIVGGAFYNPSAVQFPDLFVGKYFFTDFCGGWIDRIQPGAGPAVPSVSFVTGLASAVDVKVSANGALYALSRGGGGTVVKYVYPSNSEKTVDFTKDTRADISVWRPGTGVWHVLDSTSGASVGTAWGLPTDKPVPGDYDGDDRTDVAVWRPSTGIWYISRSSDGGSAAWLWGDGADVPMPGDYDGDGRTDPAVFRPSNSTWYILNSGGGTTTRQWGLSGDVPVQGDYDGDGKTDVAVWRPSTGTWFVLRSEDLSFFAVAFGVSTDVPIPGDYDGDGRIDVAVFRPAGATWFIQRSTGGTEIQSFGLGTDQPVPSAFVRVYLKQG
jgi:glucose/arabinose dehydrogenase